MERKRLSQSRGPGKEGEDEDAMALTETGFGRMVSTDATNQHRFAQCECVYTYLYTVVAYITYISCCYFLLSVSLSLLWWFLIALISLFRSWLRDGDLEDSAVGPAKATLLLDGGWTPPLHTTPPAILSRLFHTRTSTHTHRKSLHIFSLSSTLPHFILFLLPEQLHPFPPSLTCLHSHCHRICVPFFT